MICEAGKVTTFDQALWEVECCVPCLQTLFRFKLSSPAVARCQLPIGTAVCRESLAPQNSPMALPLDPMSMIAGDEDCGDESENPRVPPRKRHRTKTAVVANHSASKGAGDRVCHLCSQQLGESKPVKTLLGFVFHEGACFNAVRCHRRLAGNTPTKLKELNEAMSQRPDTWREDVMPLRAEHGAQRSSASRHVLKQRLTTYSKQSERDRLLVLNKTRFKSYKCFWDRCGSSEASSDFERLHCEQGGEEDSGSERKVAVTGNRTRDRERGTVDEATREFGPRSSCDRDKAHQQQGRDRTRSHRSQSQGRSSRIRHGGRHRRRSGHREQDTLHTHRRAEDESPTPSVRRGRRARSEDLLSNCGSARSSVPLTSAALAKFDDERSPSRAQIGNDRASMRSQRVGQQQGGSKMSPLQFMQGRAKLKESLTKAKEHTTQKGSVLLKLKAAKKKMSPAQLNSLDKDPKHVIDEIERVLTIVEQNINDLENAKVATWKAFAERCTNALEELSRVEEQAGEDLEAINFIQAEVNREQKTVANAARYVRMKLQNRLCGGGFKRELAKAAAHRLLGPDEPMSTNPSTFSASELILWMPVGGTEGQDSSTFPSEYMKWVESFEGVEQKEDALGASLGDHPKWKGCMTRIPCPTFDCQGHLGEDLCDPNHPGAAPWLVAMRLASWRHGPGSWPLPGFGCFVTKAPPRLCWHASRRHGSPDVVGQRGSIEGCGRLF